MALSSSTKLGTKVKAKAKAKPKAKSKTKNKTRKTKPTLPRQWSLALIMRDTSRLFGRSLERRLKRHDISIGMWHHLRVLWDKDGITQREIAEQLGNSGPTTVAAIVRLEKFGLVIRTQCTKDQRKSHIHLTGKGKALERKIIGEAVEVQSIALDEITEDEMEVFFSIITRMRDSILAEES
jgi:DNA-binding MarR family transcriptional regulator